MLRVEGLSKRYGSTQALKDLSFAIPKGQVLGLLGQNGAGKTSLLNILSGYLPADEGSVLINDINLMEAPIQYKEHIGYLPEQPPLYPEMRVTEYLQFCCELKGVLKPDRAGHIEELIALCGLEPVRRKLAGHLSRGYRQRLGLAQALCGAPELIFLDEPTSGFDPSQAYEFRRSIASLADKHSIIFSSHILSEVRAICDRVLIIHEGKLVYDHDMHAAEGGIVRYQLKVKYEGKGLLAALRGLPSVQRVRQDRSEEPGITAFSVEVAAEAPFQEELFRLLSGLQAPILLLNPIEDSLEDVFLRVTGLRAGREANA